MRLTNCPSYCVLSPKSSPGVIMASLDVSQLFGIKGYVALVTGGSSGLGLMIAKVQWHYDLSPTAGVLEQKRGRAKVLLTRLIQGPCNEWGQSLRCCPTK